MELIEVEVKTLKEMSLEYGSDYLGIKTTPQFNVFMESWLPKNRKIKVIPIPNTEYYLMGTLNGQPYYLSNQHIKG